MRLTSNVQLLHHYIEMRTTLNLDDSVLEDLKEYADRRSLALGKAASQLLRKGLASSTPTRMVNGFVVFDIPTEPRKITTQLVKKIESDLE